MMGADANQQVLRALHGDTWVQIGDAFYRKYRVVFPVSDRDSEDRPIVAWGMAWFSHGVMGQTRDVSRSPEIAMEKADRLPDPENPSLQLPWSEA